MKAVLWLLSVVACSGLIMPSRTKTVTGKQQRASRTFPATTPNKESNIIFPTRKNRDSKRIVCVSGGASSREEGANDGANNAKNGTTDIVTSAASTARVLLLLVALLYGTLNVSLRLVYALPDPPEASALSATRGWLATACFVPLLLTNNKKKMTGQSQNNDNDTGLPSTTTPISFWWAAAELAVWNFGAQGLLTLGLLSVASARASFLTQLSVVLTPVISLVAGQSIASTVWLACVIALGGLTLLSGGLTGIVNGGLALGDLIVIAGALCWSLYLFRLSQMGGKFAEIPLQAGKTFLLGILYSLWCLAATLTTGENVWVGWQNPLSWAFLLYSALGPGTVADILQAQGQKSVSATEANILLSLEPVFTALCAFLVLGETTSMMENIGGGLILAAAFIATL